LEGEIWPIGGGLLGFPGLTSINLLGTIHWGYYFPKLLGKTFGPLGNWCGGTLGRKGGQERKVLSILLILDPRIRGFFPTNFGGKNFKVKGTGFWGLFRFPKRIWGLLGRGLLRKVFNPIKFPKFGRGVIPC